MAGRDKNALREKIVDGYKALMPSEVPGNAYAEITGEPDFMGFGVWMVFKWTDEKSGKQMMLRTMACQLEQYEVRTANGKRVKRYSGGYM